MTGKKWNTRLFQSTLPRGERRPWFYKVLFHIRDFNPRSHGGSDYLRGYITGFSKNFNPRSHGGSDAIFTDDTQVGYISIHAPTGGATMDNPFIFCSSPISIHAPTGGATINIKIYVVSNKFQSTLPRGERRKIPFWYYLVKFISIHAPTGGATPGTAFFCV